MLRGLFDKIVQSAVNLTPAKMADSLLSQMKSGVPPSQVAQTLANFPGIGEKIGDANVDTFWNFLMNDPEAKRTIHPMDRAALKAYMGEVLTQTRALIGQ